MAVADHIIDKIGEEAFSWLSQKLNKDVTLMDIPDEIVNRIVSVDISLRNYMLDPSAITAIAVITFAYKLAGKEQKASFGGKDILLLKVLTKREKARREGSEVDDHPLWNSPLYELITGQVGDRVRSMRCMDDS